MYSNVYDNKFINIKELIDNSEFEKAYNALKSISERCSKWYYLNSLSAMNLGYYEEGEESITKASEMDPEQHQHGLRCRRVSVFDWLPSGASR